MILSPRAPAGAPMEKSPEAYRTIREVADSLDLPQHVLRFWETRFPQIRPLKRAGGRRYYRPDDIERLRLIKRLLYDEGYTIKGVQALSLAVPGPADASREAPNVAEPHARLAQETDKKETQATLADDDRAALRQALSEIVEAQRILAQANAPASCG